MDDNGNGTDSEITFPDDLKHLRIEGVCAIEVMLTEHRQGRHMRALEEALNYVRIIKRMVAKAEAEIEGVTEELTQPTTYDPQADEAWGTSKKKKAVV